MIIIIKHLVSGDQIATEFISTLIIYSTMFNNQQVNNIVLPA